MRFSPAFVYPTNHSVNIEVSKLLCAGFRGKTRRVTESPPPNSLALMYGILRGTGEILKRCEVDAIDYIYCDHSYFDGLRVDYHQEQWAGYYRLVPNHRYFRFGGDMPPDRWERLGIELKPWRTDGRHVLVCPPSKHVAEFMGVDVQAWTQQMLAGIKEHTDRPVVVKQKNSKEPLAQALSGAWVLVTMNSNAAVNAVVEGVPVIASHNCAAYDLGSDLADIEEPNTPDREQHMRNLAYQQFTPQELADGTARGILVEQFGDEGLPEAA